MLAVVAVVIAVVYVVLAVVVLIGLPLLLPRTHTYQHIEHEKLPASSVDRILDPLHQVTCTDIHAKRQMDDKMTALEPEGARNYPKRHITTNVNGTRI